MPVSQQLSSFNYSIPSSPISTIDAKTTGTSAVWVIPGNVTKVRITVVGGGGSGSNDGGGGGGGGTAIKVLTALTPGNTLTYTVGGAGATSQVASGTQAITTVSATGGSTSGTSSGDGGAGGIGSNGDLNIKGGGGVANSVDLSTTVPVFGAGGASYLGGGAIGSTSGAVVTGGAYGGGGRGGRASGTAPTSGAAGVVIFEY